MCRSALLLSFCENRLCLSQLIKKLNSMERGALFRHFCVSKVINTAHAHKSGVIFHLFSRAFKQKKIKALRPKMTKKASREGPALNVSERKIHRGEWRRLRDSLSWHGQIPAVSLIFDPKVRRDVNPLPLMWSTGTTSFPWQQQPLWRKNRVS